jgi:NADPH:quinone reductase-like Zn-dependent oxidoreductase
MDFSGVVQAVGDGVSRFRPGDRVFGATGASARGAHAELVAVPESGAVVAKPSFLSDEEAAAIPFGANAALAFIRDFGAVKPGQRVLVVGASGGVGVWAVQLARHFGAEVTGVASAANLELVRSLGAHRVHDYAAGPYAQAGDAFDLIFDTVGVTSFAQVRPALSATGTYLPLNGGFREMMQALFTSKSRGPKVKYAVSQNTREGLELAVQLIESGALKPVVDGVFPMEQIAEAHRRVEGRHKRGSVVVRFGG